MNAIAARSLIARIWRVTGSLAVLAIVVGSLATIARADPLPSWRDGAVKSAIVDFVARVTMVGHADFVPQAERIATFDNDGTLWAEQPTSAQGYFLIDRVKELAASQTSMRDRQPFKALIEGDHKALHELGPRGIAELFFATHAGMTIEAFDEAARKWMRDAKHPESGRRFTAMAYLPQLELLEFLRANGFKTYIVSGSGVEFMRAFAEEVYGIPREQVIGSNLKLRFVVRDDRAVLVKSAEAEDVEDREAKPQHIGQFIGRRPIIAFGNSDGDLEMLQYTMSGHRPRLALLLHHDDAEREVAYDRDFKLSPLSKALDHAGAYGITLVSMRRDWGRVFQPSD
jgi:phosphoserine phosphatase